MVWSVCQGDFAVKHRLYVEPQPIIAGGASFSLVMFTEEYVVSR